MEEILLVTDGTHINCTTRVAIVLSSCGRVVLIKQGSETGHGALLLNKSLSGKMFRKSLVYHVQLVVCCIACGDIRWS